MDWYVWAIVAVVVLLLAFVLMVVVQRRRRQGGVIGIRGRGGRQAPDDGEGSGR